MFGRVVADGRGLVGSNFLYRRVFELYEYYKRLLIYRYSREHGATNSRNTGDMGPKIAKCLRNASTENDKRVWIFAYIFR